MGSDKTWEQPPAGHTRFAGEERAIRRAEAEAVNRMEEDVWFAPLGDQLRVAEAEAGADDYGRQQAAQLQQGLETRGGPAMPGTYYLGYEHPDMKAMVEDNLDPGQINDTGAAWNRLGNKLQDFRKAFTAAVNQSTEDWSGAAGDAARGYLTQLGESLGNSGQGFQLAANRMDAQSSAAAQAKNAMPEPVQFSMEDAIGMIERESNPFTLQDTMGQVAQKFAQKQQAHEEAARVMTTYAQSLAESGSTMPAFAPAPTMTPGGGGEVGGPIGSGVSGSSGGSAGTFSGQLGGVGASGFGGGGGTPAGQRVGGNSVGGGGGGTSSQGFQPGPNPFLPGTPPGGGNVQPDPIRGGGGFPGRLPGDFVSGNPGGPGPGGRGGFGQGGGRGGFGPTGGGPGGGFGGRGGGFGPTGGGPGAGQGPGAPTGGRMPGESMAGGRGPAGAAGGRAGAGGAGMGGMGGMGGSRGQGGEDTEHQRAAYLIEPDPDDIFGTDQRTAPPVIQ